MANYHTHFSCLFDLGTHDHAKQALEIYEAMSMELENDGGAIGFIASVGAEGSTTTLWIRDEDHGDPEHVIEFVERCAEAFKLDGLWGFEWADTCSRPRLDGFGGGAHVVDLATGETHGWNNTRSWLCSVLKAPPKSETKGPAVSCTNDLEETAKCNDPPSEAIIYHSNGTQLRCPSYPEPVSYVRVVSASGDEIGYWTIDEVAEDPADVLGAMIGAVLGGRKL